MNDTIKVALLSSAYVPNYDTHTGYASLTNEITGTGYTPGGMALTGKALMQDAPGNFFRFNASNTTWTAITATFRYAVVYDDTATGKPLLVCVNFLTNQVATNQDLTLQWNYQIFNEETFETEDYEGILDLRY